MKGKQHIVLGICAGLAVAEVSQGGGGQRLPSLPPAALVLWLQILISPSQKWDPFSGRYLSPLTEYLGTVVLSTPLCVQHFSPLWPALFSGSCCLMLRYR